MIFGIFTFRIFFLHIVFLNISYGKKHLVNIRSDVVEETSLKTVFSIRGLYHGKSYRIFFNNISSKFIYKYSWKFCENVGNNTGKYFSMMQYVKSNKSEISVKLKFFKKLCCAL